MDYYVKFKDGVPQNQRMRADNWTDYVELVYDDGSHECPEGFLPVRKVLPRPEPVGSQRLGWTYTPDNGEMRKDYFIVHAYSTSDLIYALMTRGVYEQCREWIVEQGLHDLVLATKEFTSDLKYFETIKTGLQQLLGYTDEQVAEVLAEAEL